MRKQKNKGITLIALVITIIVLLILAGVTIATLTGENGILTRASDAKEETRYATIMEEKDLWEVNKLADNQTGSSSAESKEEVINRLYQNGIITEEERDLLLAGKTITVAGKPISFGTTLVDMLKKAQTDGCEGGEDCTDSEGHLHIGDYIEYNPIETGDTGTEEKYKYESLETNNGYGKQSYTVNNYGETVNWIVLGLSDDGNSLLITTGSPVRKENDNPYLYLRGSTGYIHAEDELNTISEIYGHGNYATGARSITVEDINKLAGYDPNEEKYGKGNLKQYGNKVTVQGNGAGSGSATYSWKNATNGCADGTFSGNHKTSGFNYIEDNQVKIIAPTDSTTTVELESTYYNYYAPDYINENSPIYNKFFKAGDNYYWLASHDVFVYSLYTYFSVRAVYYSNILANDLFVSDGGEYGGCYGVRPVVSLESGVTGDEITIIGTTPTEPDPNWGGGDS